jgi:hypothetical protein
MPQHPLLALITEKISCTSPAGTTNQHPLFTPPADIKNLPGRLFKDVGII